MLENKPKMYRLGVVAPRSFNDMNVLEELLIKNIASISHIVTNSVISGGETVQAFAKKVQIPFTVYPVVHRTGGALISNAQIIQNSDFVYVINDGQSENAENVIKECEKRNRKYKVIPFVPAPQPTT